MSESIHVVKRDFPAVLRNAFPAYRGRKFCFEAAEKVQVQDDSWSSGTKYDYAAVNLETGKVAHSMREYTNPFTSPTNGRCPTVQIPPGVAIVIHKRFCGSDLGLTAVVRPENLQPMLPRSASVELTEQEQSALRIIKSIKGGQYRRDEWSRAGLGAYGAEHPAIVSLIAKGLLKANRAGAVSVTLEGRNLR